MDYLLACKIVDRNNPGTIDSDRLHRALQVAAKVRDDTYMWQFARVLKQTNALLAGPQAPQVQALYRRCTVEFPGHGAVKSQTPPRAARPPATVVRAAPAAAQVKADFPTNAYAPLSTYAEYIVFCASMAREHPKIDFDLAIGSFAAWVSTNSDEYKRRQTAMIAKVEAIVDRDPAAKSLMALIARCEAQF